MAIALPHFHAQEAAQVEQRVGKREPGDRQHVGPDRGMVGKRVEQRRADADRHHPPGQRFGEDAGAAPAHLPDTPQPGGKKGQIGQCVDRFGPEFRPGPLAIKVDRRQEGLPHADCCPNRLLPEV
jgi:hypothetical protein